MFHNPLTRPSSLILRGKEGGARGATSENASGAECGGNPIFRCHRVVRVYDRARNKVAALEF